jgi:methionyl-tRNA formyltransferase
MRFAICTTDRYLGVLNAFLNAGWQPLKLFTLPVDNRMFQNRVVINRAEKLGLPIQISRLREADLQELKDLGCDVLIVASYTWRILDWERFVPHAINFHPSPLPQGRGPYPVVRAIIDNWDHWGVSCHKLAPEFDSGDLLDQEHFPLSSDECHESLDLKVQMAATKLAQRVSQNFSKLWTQAWPQGEGSYFRMFGDGDRTLDFHQPVADILRRARAFGEHECFALVNDARVFVRRAVGWPESHDYPPGQLVVSTALRMVIAAKDGYIGLLEWSLVAPDFLIGKTGR